MKGTFRAFAASGLLVAALAGVDAAMAQKQGGTVATIRLSRTRPPERLVARRSLLRKRARRRVQAGAPTRSSRRPMLSSRACTPAKSSFIPAKSRSSAPSRVITSSKLLIMLILLAADRSQHVQDQLTAFDFLCGPATQFAAPGHLAIRSRRLFSAAMRLFSIRITENS
jgi:hypothetical protein